MKKIKNRRALNSIYAATDNDMTCFELSVKGNTIYFPDNSEINKDDFHFYLKAIIANYQNLLNYNHSNNK